MTAAVVSGNKYRTNDQVRISWFFLMFNYVKYHKINKLAFLSQQFCFKDKFWVHIAPLPAYSNRTKQKIIFE